jgi:LeuA allosteric (dimerisation) domain
MPETPTPTIHLTRWTVTSGSNARSRGAVVIGAGEHQWRASAEGNGAIDALYQAVDQALSEILSGHPRLLAYDIHALGEGTDTIGAVTVRVAPPDVGGARGTGEYVGEARSTNIIAASVEAYLGALNAMLAEAQWKGAPEEAVASGTRARKKTPVAAGVARERRADIDEDKGHHDTTAWFER